MVSWSHDERNSLCKQCRGMEKFRRECNEISNDERSHSDVVVLVFVLFWILCERQQHLRSVDRFLYRDIAQILICCCCCLVCQFFFRATHPLECLQPLYRVSIVNERERDSRFKLNVMHLISVIDNLGEKRQQLNTHFSSCDRIRAWRAINDGNVSNFIYDGILMSFKVYKNPCYFHYSHQIIASFIFVHHVTAKSFRWSIFFLFWSSPNEIQIFLCSDFFALYCDV